MSIHWNRISGKCFSLIQWRAPSHFSITPSTYTIHKHKLKVDKRLKYKSWHYKSSRTNIGRKISGIQCSNTFMDMSPRAKDKKERINKWNFIKIKGFCTATEKLEGSQPYGKRYSPMLPQTRVWSPKYTKNSHDSIPGRQTIQFKKWAKDLNRPELLQGRHTEGPETYERMLSITNHQRDAN